MVSDWLKGKRLPSVDKIESLSKYLNCPVTILVVESDMDEANFANLAFVHKMSSLRQINLWDHLDSSEIVEKSETPEFSTLGEIVKRVSEMSEQQLSMVLKHVKFVTADDDKEG